MSSNDANRCVEQGSGLRFRTFKVNHDLCKDENALNGKVIICTNDLGDGNLEVGMSFCSPKDKFSRPYGQFIAYERMMHKRTKKLIPKWVDETPVHERLKNLVLEVAGEKNVAWMNNVMSADLI